MATLNSTLNVISCGASGSIGTGLKGCKKFIRKVQKAWLVPQGYVFDGDTDLTDDYVNTLVASGKIIVLSGIRSIEDESKQNTYEDIGDGIDVLDVEGLYGFKFKFIEGLYYNQVLDSLSGIGRYDILFVDNTGKLMGTVAKDGESLKGFTLGTHQVELMEGILSKSTAREQFKVQLTQTYEMSNTAIKDRDVDFNGLNASGVNEVVVKYVSTPQNGDTTITLKLTRMHDGKPFTGVDFNYFNRKIGGVERNPTGGDDTLIQGTYPLTVPSVVTGQVESISLYDNSNNRASIDLGGELFKSNTATKTAVA